MNSIRFALFFVSLSVGVAVAGGLPKGSTFDQLSTDAMNGDAIAELDLGIYYMPSGEDKGNLSEGFKWISKSAKDGESHAQEMLGMFYEHGTGGMVEKDNNKAAYWYLRAAKQGDEQAQLDIGWMCFNGEGVIKDYVEAYKWFNIASTSTLKPPTREQLGNIDEESITNLLQSISDKAKEDRDVIAPLMTPEQIAEAQRRSAEFVPQKEKTDSTPKSSPGIPYATGTGFFITDDGYLISNYHVVGGGQGVFAHRHGLNRRHSGEGGCCE